MKLQYLGNCLEEVKKVFAYCQRNISFVADRQPTLTETTEKLLGPFVTDGVPDFSSWFNVKCTQQSWHTDCVGNSFYKGAIICSYPNPTYIFLPDKEMDMDAWIKNCLASNELLIQKMLKEKRGKIFIPNPGDIYYMDRLVIHKSNPLSVDNAHLCMRVSLYTDVNWMKKINQPKIKKSVPELHRWEDDGGK